MLHLRGAFGEAHRRARHHGFGTGPTHCCARTEESIFVPHPPREGEGVSGGRWGQVSLPPLQVRREIGMSSGVRKGASFETGAFAPSSG